MYSIVDDKLNLIWSVTMTSLYGIIMSPFVVIYIIIYKFFVTVILGYDQRILIFSILHNGRNRKMCNLLPYTFLVVYIPFKNPWQYNYFSTIIIVTIMAALLLDQIKLLLQKTVERKSFKHFSEQLNRYVDYSASLPIGFRIAKENIWKLFHGVQYFKKTEGNIL